MKRLTIVAAATLLLSANLAMAAPPATLAVPLGSMSIEGETPGVDELITTISADGNFALSINMPWTLTGPDGTGWKAIYTLTVWQGMGSGPVDIDTVSVVPVDDGTGKTSYPTSGTLTVDIPGSTAVYQVIATASMWNGVDTVTYVDPVTGETTETEEPYYRTAARSSHITLSSANLLSKVVATKCIYGTTGTPSQGTTTWGSTAVTVVTVYDRDAVTGTDGKCGTPPAGEGEGETEAQCTCEPDNQTCRIICLPSDATPYAIVAVLCPYTHAPQDYQECVWHAFNVAFIVFAVAFNAAVCPVFHDSVMECFVT